MRSRILVVVFILSGIIQVGFSQIRIEKGYFLFPINPGKTNYLTGSMGELRSNHFHAGVDVKTNGQIGLPVYCSADGYVSRIKISSFGYGKVVYITHPNGLTTVYAHLDKLNSILSEATLKKQYELQAFEIDWYPEKNKLPVKKGEVLAQSGNTGSSGGPHLHYEIRDSAENVWNPLLFGFDEIKDNLPPIFQSLAVRTFGIGSLVENEFGKKDYTLLKSGSTFTLSKPITALGLIGMEIQTFDKMNETHNKYGITCIELKVNGKETFFHNLQFFSFDDGKKINAHIDYETYIGRNQRYQKCYVGDGNKSASYKKNTHNGQLLIEQGQSYKIEITVYDAYANSSTLLFTIDGKERSYAVTTTDLSTGGYRVFENILKVKAAAPKDTAATFYIKGKRLVVNPSYLVNKYPVYLVDLRLGLPDSVEMAKSTERFDFLKPVYPGETSEIEYDDFKIRFSDTTLIDTLYLELSCIKDPTGKHCLNIHDPTYPVFGKIDVSYEPKSGVNLHPNSYLALNGRKYEDSKIKDNALVAQTKYLGNFVIVKDTIRPIVSYVTHSAKSIKFTLSDSGSGIDSIYASIDGKWLLMHYEHKKRSIWSENEDKNSPLKGKFILKVMDKAGNIRIFEKLL